MAVRVTQTEPDPKVVKKVSCGGCGATLEYVPNDVETHIACCDKDDGFSYVVCPNCNKKVVVG